jgi:hypothetical protein
MVRINCLFLVVITLDPSSSFKAAFASPLLNSEYLFISFIICFLSFLVKVMESELRVGV